MASNNFVNEETLMQNWKSRWKKGRSRWAKGWVQVLTPIPAQIFLEHVWNLLPRWQCSSVRAGARKWWCVFTCVHVCNLSSLIPEGGAGTLSRTGSTCFSQLSAVLQPICLKFTSALEWPLWWRVLEGTRPWGCRLHWACLWWLLDQRLSARTRDIAPLPCQGQAVPSSPVGHPSGSPPLVVPGTIAHISLPCIIVCPAGRRTPGGKAVFLSSLHPPSTQLVLSALKTEDTLLTSHLPPPPASLLLFFWVFRAPSSQVLMCSLQIACIWKTLTSKLHLGMSQKIHVFLVHGIKAK